MPENFSNIAGNFVFDMDEVLVDISPAMYATIRLNWRKYSRWFKDLGPLSDKQVQDRDNFYVDEWLIKDEIKNLPESELKKEKSLIFKNLLLDFFNTDFYSILEPTEFAKRTLMNPLFIDNARVNKVYIITKFIPAATEMMEHKQKFIKKWFKSSKIELIFVPSKQKKSDAIREHKIQWNLYVDDELKNIHDFIENLNIEGKEFLIPRFGYNHLDPLTDIVIKEKGASCTYY